MAEKSCSKCEGKGFFYIETTGSSLSCDVDVYTKVKCDCRINESNAKKQKRIKPCPCCGTKSKNSPLIVREKEYITNIRKTNCFQTFFRIVCLHCHLQSADYDTEEKAINDWNTRIIEQRILSALKHLDANEKSEHVMFIVTRIIDGKTDAEIEADLNEEQCLRNKT